MKLTDKIRNAVRSYVLGPAVVSSWDEAWGIGSTEDQPAYGDYVKTSNAVYTCATLRAELLASLPLRLYKLNKSGEQSEVTGTELNKQLERPNEWWTQNRLLHMTELALCLWGKAYWFIDRGSSGKGAARGIYWARPDRVEIIPDRDDYVNHFIYKPTWGGRPLEFGPGETLWLRFPNPLDEYDGLSPMGAARLAADTASSAMKSNKQIFDNGLQPGGFITPPSGQQWSMEQAKEWEEILRARFKGEDKRHRWAVMRTEMQMQAAPVTPKDAEFLGMLAWALEDVCRAYKVPLDLIGGQRTYENMQAAMKAMWSHCILPEADFIASEITLQLLPIFGNADLAEFDHSKVEALQEDRSEIVTQMKTLYDMGVPLNALLTEFQPNLLPSDKGYDWGDVWWAPMAVMPADVNKTVTPAPTAAPEQTTTQGAQATYTRTVKPPPVAYGSDEHRRLWMRFARRTDAYMDKMTQTVTGLFNRQKDSILDKLKAGRGQRDLLDTIFNMAAWVAAFRDGVMPVLRYIVRDSAENALDDLGLTMSFDIDTPAVARFLRDRAQRFAEQVNETTWRMLKDSLGAGMDEGEGIPELSERVSEIMADRIRSTPETIARTEVLSSSNGGILEAWKQSDVVIGKRWLSTLDDRVRDAHREAHGQTVGIDEDFEVGGAHGPMPGQLGEPELDINCRCTATAVLDMGE